jgi:hypothetical protein
MKFSKKKFCEEFDTNGRFKSYNISVGNSPIYGSLGMGVVGHEPGLAIQESADGEWMKTEDVEKLITFVLSLQKILK